MNPYDNIGTTRLSTSVHDRLCRLAVTYQDAAAERGIVALRAPQFDQALAGPARHVRSGLVATPWRSPAPRARTRTSGRAPRCAARST